ncbi:ATP-dependent DNA helicase RecG [Candidatus Kaiserbacteria bacterium]|nr:ATP-dependent DNA helicase RecG [Candidatus Kaiserbacteria bacterium]
MKPTDPLAEHFRIDSIHKKALSRLRIETIEDLLLHLPKRYEDIANIQSVGGLSLGEDAVVYGQIGGLKSRKAWKSRRPIAEGWVEDGSARMKVMWFNQPYLAKMLTNGMYVKLSGKVTGSEGKLYLANPEVEKLDSLPIDRHDSIFKDTEKLDETLYPVYPETKGVTSKWFFHTVKKCFDKGILDELSDPIPEAILKKYNLPELTVALQWIHTPKKAEHTESARKRFAFEEVFYIQTQKARERATVESAACYQFTTDGVEEFISRFPFTLTGSQQSAIDAILEDFNGKHAMSRLLEGDVGSGKTAVAATTAYAVATSRPDAGKDWGNLQVAYMAPTEILAKQHFESFIEYFHHLPIQVGLITGSGCMKFPSKVDPTKPTKISKAQLLKWVKNGEIPILIGTHALIYKSVEFKHLAHVIIDEQHRFGTNQRKALAKKDARMPHLLSMTATPIPRTLALTVYGDLDITLLEEMPSGRKPIITDIVTPEKQKDMYEHVRSQLDEGRQAYVICPRIDEPDPDKATALRLKSVKAEAKRLKETEFKEYRIGILHGKMTPKEKDDVMKQFADHEIDVLVATSVVEVGVNVPNATNIIIEGAERFGLSQLHQLRGRVIRGTHQPYCFAVTDSKSDKTKERLKALTSAKNGFELAEYDLAFRGSGELYGAKQSGLTDLGMEALKNIKLVEAARTEAYALVESDPELEQHPRIRERLLSVEESLHME